MRSMTMAAAAATDDATASTGKMDSNDNLPKKKFINTNLISLKCLLFLFFGGMGCLFPFLGLHMTEVGFRIEEIRLVSMISPAVALLGPLVAGPMADRLATSRQVRGSNGRYLRVMIAICCVLSALFYSALLLVPRPPSDSFFDDASSGLDGGGGGGGGARPDVKFSCDRSGAIVQQERCSGGDLLEAGCHLWSDESRVGPFLLENCNYACYPITPKRWHAEAVDPETSLLPDADNEVIDLGEGCGETTVGPLENAEIFVRELEESRKTRRYVTPENEPPHLCFKEGRAVVCHVYTEYSGSLAINASLEQALNPENKEEWCAYPVDGYFSCRIPADLDARMAEFNKSCSIECDLIDPYLLPGSILAESRCRRVSGWAEAGFWIYLVVRSIADIFPTTGVALLEAAVVIATRETSRGRGDVGRQLAFGSLGFAIFGPLSGYLTLLSRERYAAKYYYLPICLHALTMLLSALVALTAHGMPLSPPEWWWHTRSGMLALPMSAVKRYGCETVALLVVLVIMGSFWSAMDTYLPLHLRRLGGDESSIGVAMTVGAIPALLFLWKSEHLVDYCGHSNLLITAFTVYIIRFTGLSLVAGAWWSLIAEALEVFTLGIMWVTAILYLRHLVPRHLTVTAQALPVIAHFCIGRCIGAVIGAYVGIGDTDLVDSLRFVYRCMAVAAAVVAVSYFLLYHGILKPRCRPSTVQGTRHPPTIVQAMNGNGNYTPLRVYHNGMGRKGQFRY